MTAAIGDVLTWTWPLTDSAGASLTGKAASLSTIVARRIASDGTRQTIAPSAWAEDGSTGTYYATLVAVAAGNHYLHARYSESGQPVQNRAATIPVVTAAQADPVAGLTSVLAAATVTVSSPLNPTTGTITVVKGDDYLNADGRAFSWDLTGFPSLVGATVEWRAIRDGRVRLTKAATVVDSDTIRVELASADTGRLWITGGSTTYTYAVVETAPDEITLATGSLVVNAS